MRREAGRFPRWFRDRVPWLARVSRRLRRERETAMYGDEEAGLPPEELYDREDAVEALTWAHEAARLVVRLYEELVGEKP